MNNTMINVEMLYDATMIYPEAIKNDVSAIARSIARFNSVSNFLTKKDKTGLMVDDATRVQRDNILRKTVRQIFALNQTVSVLMNEGGFGNDDKLITKKIDRRNFNQSVDLLDNFWFALCEIADKKNNR